jgi:hypothetical protein
MLVFRDPRPGFDRREFLTIGSLALGGLSLPGVFQARAAGGARPLTTGKSVVFLFLHGGPTQIETFDPKMSAPEGIRSVTGEIPTALPGITFGGTFRRLAGLADKFAVIRSYRPGGGEHDLKPLVHKDFLNANLGSLYSRVAGMNHPATGMPSNVLLFPQAVLANAQKQFIPSGNFLATGPLGTTHAPFVPGGSSEFQTNLQLRLQRGRLDDRRRLLAGLDDLKRDVDHTGVMDAVDRYQQQAFDVLLRGVGDAFDLSRESARVIDRYDTSALVRLDNIPKCTADKWYADNVKSLGKLLLYARRLCEAGCGFVTVTTNFVWDMHADGDDAGVAGAMPYTAAPLDHAVSAFIQDVEARGLSDQILLVVCGEMGRTPKLNQKGGRDHWGNLGPLLLHGGGLKMGQVIGRSTANAGDPATEPITPKHLVTTIMHALFDVGEVRKTRGIPDGVARVITDNEPIKAMF